MYQEAEKKSILGKIAEAFLGAFSSIYIVNTDYPSIRLLSVAGSNRCMTFAGKVM